MMGDLGPRVAAFDDLINFSIGDPDLKTDDRIIEAAFQEAMAGNTHYTDTRVCPGCGRPSAIFIGRNLALQSRMRRSQSQPVHVRECGL